MLQPTLDYVAVKKPEAAKMTPGGLHLPDNVKKETYTGEVVAVGPGRWDNETESFDYVLAVPFGPDRFPQNGVKPGDVVVFNQYAGNNVKVDEVEYLILQADEVLAILPPKPADPTP